MSVSFFYGEGNPPLRVSYSVTYPAFQSTNGDWVESYKDGEQWEWNGSAWTDLTW